MSLDTATPVDEIFAGLADPTRRRLLDELAGGPRRAGDLAEPFAVSRPAISRHLRVLRESGLVVAETRGREIWYRLDPVGLDQAGDWLEELRQTWRAALKSLKEHVEAGP